MAASGLLPRSACSHPRRTISSAYGHRERLLSATCTLIPRDPSQERNREHQSVIHVNDESVCTCRNGSRSQEQGRTRRPSPCCRTASPAASVPSPWPQPSPTSPPFHLPMYPPPPPIPPPSIYSELLPENKRNLLELFPVTNNTSRSTEEGIRCFNLCPAHSAGRNSDASRRGGGRSGGAGSCSSPVAWGSSEASRSRPRGGWRRRRCR